MSGGSSDSATLAIGYRDRARRVVCGTWDQGRKPPFNPHDAITRFAGICEQYGVSAITADTYGRKAPTLDFERAFRQAGISYRPCALSTAALYEAFEAPLNAGEIVLPDDPETLEQLAGLQNRGRKIEHRSGEHDDRANAIAGLCWLLGEGTPSPAELISMVRVSGTRLSAGLRTAGMPHDRNPWLSAGGGAKKEWMDEVQEDPERGGAHVKGRRAVPDW